MQFYTSSGTDQLMEELDQSSMYDVISDVIKNSVLLGPTTLNKFLLFHAGTPLHHAVKKDLVQTNYILNSEGKSYNREKCFCKSNSQEHQEHKHVPYLFLCRF